MEIFGKRLRELRLESNLKISALAKMIDVSSTTIIRWEKGQRSPSIMYLYILSKLFKVEADYLVGLKDY